MEINDIRCDQRASRIPPMKRDATHLVHWGADRDAVLYTEIQLVRPWQCYFSGRCKGVGQEYDMRVTVRCLKHCQDVTDFIGVACKVQVNVEKQIASGTASITASKVRP